MLYIFEKKKENFNFFFFSLIFSWVGPETKWGGLGLPRPPRGYAPELFVCEMIHSHSGALAVICCFLLGKINARNNHDSAGVELIFIDSFLCQPRYGSFDAVQLMDSNGY